ncbi:hypothetical protein FJ365_04535 [Candidatus Dependentiae bacterium]|nr:hypothetical protein [Candidatus Dependentiae bacterium]
MKLVFKVDFCVFLLAVIFFGKVMPSTRQAFSFKQASMEDVSVLLGFYEHLSLSDKEGLLVLPGAMQVSSVSAAVSSGKFFIAYDAEEKPVAMLKIYVVSEEEREAIMQDELGASAVKTPEVLFYHCDSKKPCYKEEVKSLPTAQDAVYVYIGAQYTKNHVRKHGIQYHLLKFAFQQLFPAEGPVHMVLLYGQSGSNIHHRGPLNACCDYVVKSDSASRSFIAQRMRYPTRKPEFIDGKLEIPAGETDRGNIVYIYPEYE